MLFLLMVNLSLGNTSDVLTSLGVSMLGASTLSLLSQNNCPFVCSSTRQNCGGNVTNTTTTCNYTVSCPVGSLTKTGIVIGITSLTLGSSLNLVSLLR